MSNPDGSLFQQLRKQRPWTAGGASIFLKDCAARIFLGLYFVVLVGDLGMLLHPNPNFSVSRAPSENPHASDGIETEITQIVKPQISGYHGTLLIGDSRSHAQASASIIFSPVFGTPPNPQRMLEPRRICVREKC